MEGIQVFFAFPKGHGISYGIYLISPDEVPTVEQSGALLYFEEPPCRSSIEFAPTREGPAFLTGPDELLKGGRAEKGHLPLVGITP
jgi:hypothetical protein